MNQCTVTIGNELLTLVWQDNNWCKFSYNLFSKSTWLLGRTSLVLLQPQGTKPTNNIAVFNISPLSTVKLICSRTQLDHVTAHFLHPHISVLMILHIRLPSSSWFLTISSLKQYTTEQENTCPNSLSQEMTSRNYHHEYHANATNAGFTKHHSVCFVQQLSHKPRYCHRRCNNINIVSRTVAVRFYFLKELFWVWHYT